ncbi:uncharacterized protein A4U43_C04F9160 [Asparagus officinalis]|uniref:Uncharacterized protein n=1 Tax=Asparagus officinalis TaxID=4686 RepID=A0A5P1F252_ASPOF|nr:uncharacterized protein LOC109836931 [Asparagus officinalis]ONK71487.1 uncharacterized protein A4U43_C04F9160 [Asparagus officinalis]
MEIASDSHGNNGFPVRNKRVSLDIKGNRTDILMCTYDDYILVMVTQIGCMGTIVHARKEADVTVDPTFNVSVVFGKRDEPLLIACARQLIEHISSCGSSKPLVLSLGLKDHSPGVLKDVIAAVIEHRAW